MSDKKAEEEEKKKKVAEGIDTIVKNTEKIAEY